MRTSQPIFEVSGCTTGLWRSLRPVERLQAPTASGPGGKLGHCECHLLSPMGVVVVAPVQIFDHRGF